jgi:predicted kinase
MPTQTVVLVVGRPASGKTTLSTVIAERWGLPVVSKDAVKEILFDTLGIGDRAWSESLGKATFALLDHIILLQARTGASFLIDAAFNPAFENEKFRALQDRFGFDAIQIHCTASPDELVRRFVQRVDDGSRHPGHADEQWVDGFRAGLADGRDEVLDLRGAVLRYDSEAPGGRDDVLRRLEELLPLPGMR